MEVLTYVRLERPDAELTCLRMDCIERRTLVDMIRKRSGLFITAVTGVTEDTELKSEYA